MYLCIVPVSLEKRTTNTSPSDNGSQVIKWKHNATITYIDWKRRISEKSTTTANMNSEGIGKYSPLGDKESFGRWHSISIKQIKLSWLSRYVYNRRQIINQTVRMNLYDLNKTRLWIAYYRNSRSNTFRITQYGRYIAHAIDMLWKKFQWILHRYMKPTNFQPKASVVCSVPTAVFIDICLKKLIVFSQHIGKKQMNIWIPQKKSQGIAMSI